MMEHFDTKWIFTCGRLVCSEWNEAILSSPLSISINLGSLNRERIDQFMESGVSGVFKRLDRVAIIGLDIDAMHLSLVPRDLTNFHHHKKQGVLAYWFNYGVEVMKSFTKLSFEHVHLLSLFDGLSGLELNGVGDEGVDYLIKHKKLLDLKELCLSADNTKISQRITQEGISKLDTLKFNNLKILDLRKNMLGVAGLKQLFQSQSFPNLTSLILKECHKFEKRLDEAFKSFNSDNFSSMTYLDLSLCKIGDDGVKFIFSQKWNSLKQVNLNTNYIGVNGCKYIAESPTETIEHLELGCQGIEESACMELSKILSFKLKYLNLEKNRIGKGVEHLCKSKNLEHIETLILNNCGLHHSACEHIVNSAFNSTLTYLDIGSNSLKLERLFCGSLTSLKTLLASGRIRGNYVFENVPIRRSEALPSIQSIDLSYNTLTSNFIEWLSEPFSTLEFLNLRSTGITDQEVILLQKSKIKTVDISENRLDLFQHYTWVR
ncbi:predicted protein [Naegleria gruberi]|uniref:Predicted protein n=1 Tax=Naegleria gruberi TaxID=5762 RepID=D2VZP6_NAEGR|nr:uncharacterized protein NAEGRDRAFT_53554 [Naegleria gruberi]EFC37734.1 predicted protein [Naegleria gruberi]|eukprot:XP_002670478.1 predicted protein [Naegleria gruberi strain NEG-M]